MSEAAPRLGLRLKAERERKGFTTQKAADQLHLDGWVIEALESDEYARIGPAVYGKGHLKRYAGLLGLPAEEIADAYEGRTPVPDPVPQTSTLRMRPAETDDRAVPWKPIAGAAVLVLVGVVGVIAAAIFWRRGGEPHAAPVSPAAVALSEQAANPATSVDDSAMPGAAAAERGPSNGGPADRGLADRIPADRIPADRGPAADGTSAGAAVRVPVAAGGAEPPAGVGHVRLRLSFSADSWVDVHDAMGRRLFAGRGRANSVKTLAGAAPVQVYLGFASGVQLAVNNHVVAIGPQFVTGDVARFEAGADGILRRNPRAAAAVNPQPRG